MSVRRAEKRSRSEDDGDCDADDGFSEDDDGIDAPIYQGVLEGIPVEDQIKFSGLTGKRPRATPLSHYRLLGKSGLRVSPLCLGTMYFGQNWAASLGEVTKETAEQIFRKYFEEGGNFIDTALNYQDGEGTEWLGEWMEKQGCRDQLVIAAKYSLPLARGDINSAGNHRKSLVRAVDMTLRALRTTYLDVLYMHMYDFVTPVEEIMRSLDDLVRQGKVHYLGVSDTPAWIVARANTLASQHGWSPFVAFQGKFNPAERDAELELLPMCAEMGLGYIPWGLQPWCTRYGDGYKLPVHHVGDGANSALIDETIVGIAKAHSCTPAQVVMSWGLHKPCMTSVLLTCTTVESLDSCIGALTVRLTQEEIVKIDRAAKLTPGYPFKYIGYSYKSSPWMRMAGTVVTPSKPSY